MMMMTSSMVDVLTLSGGRDHSFNPILNSVFPNYNAAVSAMGRCDLRLDGLGKDTPTGLVS